MDCYLWFYRFLVFWLRALFAIIFLSGPSEPCFSKQLLKPCRLVHSLAPWPSVRAICSVLIWILYVFTAVFLVLLHFWGGFPLSCSNNWNASLPHAGLISCSTWAWANHTNGWFVSWLCYFLRQHSDQVFCVLILISSSDPESSWASLSPAHSYLTAVAGLCPWSCHPAQVSTGLLRRGSLPGEHSTNYQAMADPSQDIEASGYRGNISFLHRKQGTSAQRGWREGIPPNRSFSLGRNAVWWKW